MSFKAPESKERRRIPYAEWLAEGKRLYGPKTANWRFKCVQCGNVQSVKDFVDAGLTPDQAIGRAYYSCLGRVKKGVGCDWSLGGLFQFHSLEVVTEGGEVIPAFEFADTEPVFESVPVLKDEETPAGA